MESINGISFKDYACASANIASGMPVEQVCKILGIELPVWEDTMQKWNNKMAELSFDDMAFYGEVFTNPKQGKFADVDGAADSDQAMSKVPDVETFGKIFTHLSIADDHGIDTITLLENEYGMNIMEWSKISGEFSQLLAQASHDEAMYEQYSVPHNKACKKWTAYFLEKYKDQDSGIADDIDF